MLIVFITLLRYMLLLWNSQISKHLLDNKWKNKKLQTFCVLAFTSTCAGRSITVFKVTSSTRTLGSNATVVKACTLLATVPTRLRYFYKIGVEVNHIDFLKLRSTGRYHKNYGIEKESYHHFYIKWYNKISKNTKELE